MTTESLFWDRHAEAYSRRPVPDQDAYEHKLRLTRERFHAGMEVFEFGCGTGTTAITHAPFVKSIMAIDISKKMIEIARSKCRDKHVENVTFRQASIEDLTFRQASIEDLTIADETYDAVMAHSILHLLEDRNAAIAKAHRILKPGGLFVSSTACLSGVVPWLRFVLPVGRALGLVPIVKFFTAQELVDELSRAGFRIDYTWQPSKKQALFILARKPAKTGGH